MPTTPPHAADPEAATPHTAKLIEFGWDMPSMTWLRDHSQALQQTPFDGVVLDLQSDATGAMDEQQLSWQVWRDKTIDLHDYAKAVAAFDAITVPPPMENFLRLNVTPGTVDWFDEAGYAAVLANAGLVAGLAHRPGFVGIFLDVETYQAPLFDYLALPGRFQHSFGDYESQVYRSGQLFLQALTAAYPGITVLLSFGESWPTGELRLSPYGLLPAFLEGMLAAATPAVTIYDGYEQAYPYTTAQQFQAAAQRIHAQTHPQYRASFGVYDRAHPTPADLTNALTLARRFTDRYVWSYNEVYNWWDGTVPPAVMHAVIDAQNSSH